ncbi:CLUMA_CG004908, isoform A [Clunio marinus]|uniref:CLUMA_CG004908, isoform A n=1 Tax=Clunio marinus TaxID=568069 RepID=A0A1J1HUK2_9DIPT|nr:CLUMA_CG004908, isoform A [Clunio marinus]
MVPNDEQNVFIYRNIWKINGNAETDQKHEQSVGKTKIRHCSGVREPEILSIFIYGNGVEAWKTTLNY